jgi:lipoprotein-releasing system permease protein
MSVTGFISRGFNSRRALPRSVRSMRAVAAGGIVVAVASLVIAVSIGRGFEFHYRRALLNFNAHVVVMGTGEMADPWEAMEKIGAKRYASEEERGFARRWGWIAPLGPMAAGTFDLADRWIWRGAHFISQVPGLEGLASWLRSQPSRRILPDFLNRRLNRLEEIRAKGVEGTTPFLYREALAIGGGLIRGVVVKGIDPHTLETTSGVSINLLKGFDSVTDALSGEGGDGVPVVLGGALAAQFKDLTAKEGIRLLVPQEGAAEMGEGRLEKVRVVGTFESGLYDYDSQFLLMSMDDARRLFGAASPTAVSGIEVRLDDPGKADWIARALERDLGIAYRAVSWGELNRDLLAAVRLERLVFAMIMGMLVIVAAMNIIAVLVLMTMRRLPALSLLKAVGATDNGVRRIFVWQGISIGAWGCAVGLGVGSVLAWLVGRFALIPLEAEVYLIGALPIDISPMLCGMIALFCLGVAYVVSGFAARRLARVPVVEGLHQAG